jgi:hypothetical protein
LENFESKERERIEDIQFYVLDALPQDPQKSFACLSSAANIQISDKHENAPRDMKYIG